MADLEAILFDLNTESEALERVLTGLADADWTRATPAEGWTIAHQIAHLAWTDEVALIAAQDASAFADVLARAIADPDAIDREAEAGAMVKPDELLARWQASRSALAAALRAVPDGTKLPWFGPPMSAASMATARSMETWAHGQDILDALDLVHEPGPVLRHVAHLGVRTRDFAYVLNDRTPPAEAFRVELTAPDGSSWQWGPDDSSQLVRGPAVDFCLLVTQRRHRDDLAVSATGTGAEEWLGIAQAFAGPPGEGRPPGTDRARDQPA